MRHLFRKLLYLLCLAALLLSACQASFYASKKTVPKNAKVRFLLTFDDGPSGKTRKNPTRQILYALQHNVVQKDIKAIFFVQSRDPRLGGSPQGQQIMRQQFQQGHILAVHSGTARGHVSHVKLLRRGLGQSLKDCMNDIRQVTGENPLLVRPPYWAYNRETILHYQQHGLHVLLTDARAFDGKIRGYNVSLRRRSSMRKQLTLVKNRIHESLLPAVDGVIPVVVTFHDINTFTARHMSEYLHILLQEANRVGLPLSTPAFYTDRKNIYRAALERGKFYMSDINTWLLAEKNKRRH
jgi:peptidoglycan/xylan/chitin deacetylase (PgdA/CDA1 family)